MVNVISQECDWQRSKVLITNSTGFTVEKTGTSSVGGRINWHEIFARQLGNIYQNYKNHKCLANVPAIQNSSNFFYR